jgi:3-hydroxyisobutyrate dehydrogenase
MCNGETVNVGFIGAGMMGGPMVSRLVDAGHRVRVYGRREETRDAASVLGATTVASAAAVAVDATVVVLCPFDDAQVLEIAMEDGVLAAMAPGAVLVIHTTGSPRTAQSLQDEAPAGVVVVDAPVSGSATDIAGGQITLFVGGRDDAVTTAKPVLGAYGDPIMHVGALGAGQAVKLLNNALFAAHLQLAASVADLSTGLGLDPARAADAIGRGSGASRALEIVGGDAGRLQAIRRFLDKDVDTLRAVAADLEIDLGLLLATNAGGVTPFGSPAES